MISVLKNENVRYNEKQNIYYLQPVCVLECVGSYILLFVYILCMYIVVHLRSEAEKVNFCLN